MIFILGLGTLGFRCLAGFLLIDKNKIWYSLILLATLSLTIDLTTSFDFTKKRSTYMNVSTAGIISFHSYCVLLVINSATDWFHWIRQRLPFHYIYTMVCCLRGLLLCSNKAGHLFIIASYHKQSCHCAFYSITETSWRKQNIKYTYIFTILR